MSMHEIYYKLMESKLAEVFPENFQIKRVMKEMETLREAKVKLGFDLKFSITKGKQIAFFIQILGETLKKIQKLQFLKKLEFKIIMKTTYPTDPPLVTILNENMIQLNLKPFRDYLLAVLPDWSVKHSSLDIIKATPAFFAKAIENHQQLQKREAVGDLFDVERIFSWSGCQTFPIKLIKNNAYVMGLMVVISMEEIALLEECGISNSYRLSQLIGMECVGSIYKHKSQQLKIMIEVRRKKVKYGLELLSEEFETLISSISQCVKSLVHKDKQTENSSQSSDAEEDPISKKPTNDLIINRNNIKQMEEEIVIMESLVESYMTSENIKNLVDLLKKIVEFYSVQNRPEYQTYLKKIQNIMGNEVMHAFLISEETDKAYEKSNYLSLLDIN